MAAPSIRRSSSAAFVASAIGVVLGLGISILLARALGPSGKGAYDLAIATAGLLSLGLGLSLPGGIAYAVARGSGNPASLARFAYPFAAAEAGMTLAILLLGVRFAPTFTGGLTIEAVLAVTGIVLVSSVANNQRAVLVGQERIVRASALELLGRILTAAALLIVIVAVRMVVGEVTSYEAMLWATVAAGVLLCLATAAVLRDALGGPRGSRGLRVVLHFALPAHLGNALQFLNYRLDLFLVSAFSGLAAVGVYAVAVSFAQMVWLAPSSIALALLPRAAAHASRGTGMTDVARLSRMSLLISLAAAVGLAVLGPPFISLVYGSGFSAASLQLLLLLPGVAFFGQATVLAAYIGGMGHQRLNMYVSVAALVVTVVFDVALIPPLGGVGASIASSISYGCTAVLTLLVAARVGSIPAPSLFAPRASDVAELAAGIRRLVRR